MAPQIPDRGRRNNCAAGIVADGSTNVIQGREGRIDAGAGLIDEYPSTESKRRSSTIASARFPRPSLRPSVESSSLMTRPAMGGPISPGGAHASLRVAR